MSQWQATGWRGRTVLVYSLLLPGGISGRIARAGINKPWRFSTSGSEDDRRFKRRNAAIKACERHLKSELHAGLRALRTPRPTKWQ